MTDFIFHPNCGKNPSVWPSARWNDDAGFAVVDQIKTVDNVVTDVPLSTLGTLPSITFAQQATTVPQASLGCPAARPYTGKTLTWCQGETVLTYDSSDTYGMSCTMTGGSSGGPWLTGMASDGSGGSITSLDSCGHSSLKNVMPGPIFDGGESVAFGATSDGDCNADAVPCVDHFG